MKKDLKSNVSGNICKRNMNKQEELPCTSIVRKAGKKAFIEYTNNTAVHGVQYLGEEKRYRFERLFWLVMIGASFYMCAGYIYSIWNTWNNTPVIISFSEKSTPIWKFPFPTVTICPNVKTASEIFNYGNYVRELEEWQQNEYSNETEPIWLNDEKIMKYLEVNSEICDYNLTDVYEIENKYFDGSFFDIVNKSRYHNETEIKSNKVLIECWFNGEEIKCEEYFDEILTEKGLCYVFNFLNASENIFNKNILHRELVLADKPYSRVTKWSLDKGYEEDAIEEKFPFRSYSPLVEDGLYVRLLNYVEDIDPKCGGGSEGYKLSLDTPGEIPDVSKHYINIPFDHETLIDITPEMTSTEKSAIAYSPQIRHCYLENERPLNFFKSYSRTNCELECLTNHTFNLCGCVRFFMPRTSKTPICSGKSRSCYERAKKEVISRDFMRTRVDNPDKILNCNCFPSCKMLSYSTGVTEAKLRKKDTVDKQENSSISTKAADVTIYFKQRRFWTSERMKLFGTIEFIAHAGGLMGLFIGVSAVSCIEIIYFFGIKFGQYTKEMTCQN